MPNFGVTFPIRMLLLYSSFCCCCSFRLANQITSLPFSILLLLYVRRWWMVSGEWWIIFNASLLRIFVIHYRFLFYLFDILFSNCWFAMNDERWTNTHTHTDTQTDKHISISIPVQLTRRATVSFVYFAPSFRIAAVLKMLTHWGALS